MENKLRVGDKIRWNVPVGGNTIYTILDIDLSRPKTIINGYQLSNEILFQWEECGQVITHWGHSYQGLNERLNKGGIIILERRIEPNKELLKFKL